MRITDLTSKLIAVLGYGQEGQAVTRYLLKHRIEPVLFDEKPWNEWPRDRQDEIKSLGVNFIFGPDCFKELSGFDVAFRSPGIKFSQLTINNLQLTSQTKWFFDNCPARIIGITGTKGKGTTATLIAEMLNVECRMLNSKIRNQKSEIRNVYLTGNIGKDQPLDLLDNLKTDDWVVYELSSFQLQDLHKSPYIAVVLMITSEHLDYHKDNNEYVEAKSVITKFQSADDFTIINADYPASVEIGNLGQGKKIYFSGKQLPEFIDRTKIQLRGEHNLENISAAITVATALNINPDAINRAISNFKGLEHRLEFVAEKQGIKFYNDSFSTTPETAIAAIKSFDEPLIVILGGSPKNSNFDDLAKTIINAPNIKALILIGVEASRIKDAITSFVPPLKVRGGEGGVLTLKGAKNMAEIFSQIKSVAASGDTVLLSPACASFGMFVNYKDRGEQFKALAKKF